jgi:hypothetical protein
LPRARAACCRCRLPSSCPLWRCGRLSSCTCPPVASTSSQRHAGPSSLPVSLCRHGRPIRAINSAAGDRDKPCHRTHSSATTFLSCPTPRSSQSG